MPATFSRRALFGYASAAACPLCAGVRAAEPAHGSEAVHPAGAAPHWSYEGDGAPARWGELSADFRTCSVGAEQTPIDLTGGIRAQTGPALLSYQLLPLKLINNGHTIQVNTPPGSRLRIEHVTYELLQFHFHHPSEHLLSGKALDLECHFVHRAASGALAVVGVFIRPGAANPSLAPIWQAMPSAEGPEKEVAGVTVDTAALLPKQRAYFRYMGSLTTPPCSEGITWTVFRNPVEASPEQIRRFAALFPMNARPQQPLNRRFLLQTRA
jgi:carbonic anhydrase